MASSGKNVKDLLHVAIGGGGCLLWIAAALTRAQIGRVPVPPVMLGVRLLEVAVVLFRLVEEPCQGCNVHGLWSRQVPLAAGKPRPDPRTRQMSSKNDLAGHAHRRVGSPRSC